ncbi:MAG: serine/threonine protein kinase, partial [Alphaproteobacteria bacterium]|nr:serine/threonine protein kinase [Alphaproteobacteria bacterium]
MTPDDTWTRTLDLGPPQATPTPDAPALPERYEDLGLLGRGGMGEVRRVFDRKLRRALAMKLTRWTRTSPSARARFLREARLTAVLQHPGIVPVHDAGTLDDGRLWYTMPVITGETFGDRIAAHHAGTVGLHRLVSALEQASRAVAFAHSQGVVHRDIKPENLMIGAFGDVRVLDWGLARWLEAPEDLAALEPEVAEGTRAGQILGTPRYMAPEQAAGQIDAHGPRTDVFALGAVLHHLLTGRPPYPGDAQQALQAALEGPPPPPDGPEGLVALCVRAMARDPADRPADAGAFADGLAAWLDGSQRRRRALDAVAEADTLSAEPARLRAEADALDARAEVLLAEVAAHEPAAAKRPAWRLQDQAKALRSRARTCETRALQALRAALNHDPELDEAHRRLADHYQRQSTEAEQQGDDDEAERLALLVQDHDRGAHARWLTGQGTLDLVTDPPGAAVTLFRLEEVDRRLTPTAERSLGRTPLHDVPLPRGRWLLRLRAPGREDVDVPALIERDQRWDTVAPGHAAPTPIWLPPVGALGPDDRYVPAGWFIRGGDRQAPDALPRR